MAAGHPARRADGLPERPVEQPRLRALGRDSCSASRCPDRVKWIRVLLAELQRINSHLVWLGTHAMELGAVSVMLYCFRERELFLNINELIAGFRMFPSYIRVGGLREDLPAGFHEAVRELLDRMPAKLDEYEDLLTKNQIYLKRTRGVGAISLDRRARAGAGRADRARGRLDLRRPQGVPVLRLRDVRLRRAGRRRRRRLRPVPRPHRGDAPVAADLPPGARAHHADRRVGGRRPAHRAAAEGQGLHGDGSADPALPDLLAGVHRAGRRGLRAGRGAARRARVLRRVGRHEPAVAREDALAVADGVPGAAEADRRRADRRRDRRHRLDRRRAWETWTGELPPGDALRVGAARVAAPAAAARASRSPSRPRTANASSRSPRTIRRSTAGRPSSRRSTSSRSSRGTSRRPRCGTSPR